MKTGRRFGRALFLVAIVTFFICSTAHAQVPGQVPDLSIWESTWFKVKLTRTVYHFENIGVKPKPASLLSQSGGTSYIKITGWDTTTTPLTPFLTADVYARDASGNWDPNPVAELNIYYFAGSNLKFIGSSQVSDAYQTLSLVLVFTGKWNSAANKFVLGGETKISTMGSSMLEIDDVPNSTERWAGAAKLSGPMVPESRVPPILVGP
jgi:hypothetical protein